MSMTIRTVRPGEGSGLALLLMAALFFINRSSPARNATGISETEAAILVYVSPVGDRLRAGGSDVALEPQTSAQYNQADYFYFWVYEAGRQQATGAVPRAGGSVTIGYYAVNKRTGDVWDTVEKKQLSGGLLLGVQKIIRQSHHIAEDTIERYRKTPL